MPDANGKLSLAEKLLSTFSEKVGEGISSSRVLTAIVVLNVLMLADYLIFHAHAMVDLSSLTEFAMAVIGALYGVNKVSGIFINKNQNQ